MEKQAVIASLLRDDIARKIQNAKSGMKVTSDVELLEIWLAWANHVVKQQHELISQQVSTQQRYDDLEGFYRSEVAENLKLKDSNRHLAENLAKYEQVNVELQRRVNEREGT